MLYVKLRLHTAINRADFVFRFHVKNERRYQDTINRSV